MNRREDETGMALVEAILLGLALIVPLLWGLGMLDHLHRAALGASSAAREVGSAVTRASDPAHPGAEIDVALGSALTDQGLDPGRALLRLSLPDGAGRGEEVVVEIRYPVAMLELPLIGRFPSVWVNARHETVIDRYRSR